MTEDLGVKIVCLERRVVNVHLGALEEKEAMVVYKLVSSVQSEEYGDVDAIRIVDQLAMSSASRTVGGHG